VNQLRSFNIGHVGIAVRDLDRSVKFYCDVLGFKLTERFEYPEDEVGHGTTVQAGAFIRCGATHHALSIFSFKRGVADSDGDSPAFGLHHIAFELPTPEQLLEMFREVKEQGVEIFSARCGGPGNQPRFYIHDPDGNLLEFYWGIDEIGWDGIPRAYDPINEIDLENFDFEGYMMRRANEAADAQGVMSETTVEAGT
jgi:catechol 2,3-dioxygenase-like lactoylglutathione lyase family enzyme